MCHLFPALIPMQIGRFVLDTPLILAPMAGITDLPFRRLCRRFGAAMAVSEMVTSDSRLWRTGKSRHRLDHSGEPSPRVVQIAGADPLMMAEAARLNVDLGADIVDINMGCPAKRVCHAQAGSALLGDAARVRRILAAVVQAVEVPVTLKIRTGLDPQHRNGLQIARIAESEGVQAIAVHGRTRACRFRGEAEYDSVRVIKAGVGIPVIANGDIGVPEQAAKVLASTGADAIMIGRGALGRPWIFKEFRYFLNHKKSIQPPSYREVREIMLTHLEQVHTFYGESVGVRIARKHLRWYLQGMPEGESLWWRICQVDDACSQGRLLREFLTCRARSAERSEA